MIKIILSLGIFHITAFFMNIYLMYLMKSELTPVNNSLSIIRPVYNLSKCSFEFKEAILVENKK